MSRFVADTHAVIWYFSANKRLSPKVRTIFSDANRGYKQVIVPSIVLVEVFFLLQRTRVSDEVTQEILALTESPTDGIYVYPLNKGVIDALAHFGPTAVPELADRIIAATALHLNLPLLTVDHAIQNSNLVQTVW